VPLPGVGAGDDLVEAFKPAQDVLGAAGDSVMRGGLSRRLVCLMRLGWGTWERSAGSFLKREPARAGVWGTSVGPQILPAGHVVLGHTGELAGRICG